MVISIFSNYQQQQISVYAQQVVKISRRSDGGKSIKMSFKNVRYSAQKTVSNHLKTHTSKAYLQVFKYNVYRSSQSNPLCNSRALHAYDVSDVYSCATGCQSNLVPRVSLLPAPLCEGTGRIETLETRLDVKGQ